jgi:hypothetical protein
MEPTTKQLRPYQVRLVTDVCRATEDVLVEQPTGSGKTVQIVTLVAMHPVRREFNDTSVELSQVCNADDEGTRCHMSASNEVYHLRGSLTVWTGRVGDNWPAETVEIEQKRK